MSNEYMQNLINGRTLEEEQQDILKEVLNEEIESSNAKVEKWEPKEWRPEYQIIVALSTMNFDQQAISDIMAEKYNYTITKQHVNNILNTDKARELKADMLKTVVERTKDTVEKNLEEMERLAASRIVQVLSDELLFKNSPLAIMDRSLKVLEGRGKLKREIDASLRGATNNQQNNFFNLPADVIDRIDKGLKKSQLVEELHGSDKGSTRESEKRSGTDG